MIENGFTNLYTGDMAAALRFYADALGFRETFRVPKDDPDHVELTAGGLGIALSTISAARKHQGVDPIPGAPAMCLVLWVGDLHAALETAIDAGAAVITEPHAAANENHNALVRDPDGNLVEFVAKATPAAGEAHA